MRSCPVCNHTLPQQRANQAPICAFCGWKEKKQTAVPAKKKDPTFKALSAEEIARQEWKKDRGGLVPIVIGGVAFLLLLVFSFVMVISQPKEIPPPQIQRTPEPAPTATPTPTPSYTMMPIPTPSSSASNSPAPVNESSSPSSDLSGSASPLTPPDLPEGSDQPTALSSSSSASPSSSPSASSSPSPSNSAKTP